MSVGFNNSSVTLAMLSFFSTTVDDFCVILVFFAREYVKTNSFSHPATLLAFLKISVGQFMGFTIIVTISLILGLALHSVVEEQYIDLVGLLPVFIGIYKVYEILTENGAISAMCQSLCCVPISDNKDLSKAKQNANLSSGEKMPLIDVEDGHSNYLDENIRLDVAQSHSEMDTDSAQIEAILNDESLEALEQVDQSNFCVVCMKSLLCFLDPLIIEVTIYALMFGTDNIAIYVALFSGVSLFDSLAVCIFFYSLLLLYLALAMLIIVQVRRFKIV
jgi:cadmium resistance protein CadD (predicted permease)